MGIPQALPRFYMFSHPRRLFTLLAIPVLAIGCGESVNIAPQAVVTTSSATEPQAASPATKPESPQVNQEDKKGPRLAEKYIPPFPNRINAFEPPMNAPRIRSDNPRDRNSSVSLVGFANVGEPTVVLTIDGVVSPMKNGEEIAGVQVISIAPPNAVLQRGRNRWTASLTN